MCLIQYEASSWCWMEQMQQYVKNEPSIVYLQDNGYTIEYPHDEKITIFGTPWTAIYGKPGKAFQIPSYDLAEKWEKIPRSTDILITHAPPYGILDVNSGRVKSGCKDLSKMVAERIKPRIHVFGHIHESHGWEVHKNTIFINASSRKPRSKFPNSPIIVKYFLGQNKTQVLTE